MPRRPESGREPEHVGAPAVRTSHQLQVDQALDDRARTVLRLRGDVDLQTSPGLRYRIEAASQPGATLVIDLSEVRFMDSPGLGTLIHCDRLHRKHGGHLVLKNPVGAVAELFEIAMLANLLEVE